MFYHYSDGLYRKAHQSVILITAPSVDVISLANVKTALGITTTSQDGVLQAALDAVVAQIDPASGGWLGRALRPQTWELRLSSFYEHRHCWDKWGHGAIELPYPPLISITSIKYDDYSGTERTLVANTDYRTIDIGSNGRQAVAPLYNGSWPNARCDLGSVRIRFQAGYSNSPDVMPAAIPQAVALGVRALVSTGSQNLYLTMDRVEGIGEKRYIANAGAAAVINAAIEGLLLGYRA